MDELVGCRRTASSTSAAPGTAVVTVVDAAKLRGRVGTPEMAKNISRKEEGDKFDGRWYTYQFTIGGGW